MVKNLNSAVFLILLLSGVSANFLKSALNLKQSKDSAERTLSKTDNFPEPPNCGFHKTSTVTNRIHGGVPVEPHALPWMVYISMGCGGTLINSRWIITAAHCFHPDLVEQFAIDNAKAFVNAVDCEKGSCDSNAIEVEIGKYIRHEQFTPSVGHHDIALIQLKNEVKFNDKIQPICLPYNNEASGGNIFNKEAHVSGWGATENGYSSKHLLEVGVEVWDTGKCDGKKILGKTVNKLYQICAGGVAGEGSCSGDSGGPLYMQLPTAAESNTKKPYYQVGIVSFGLPCAQGTPDVYTNVSAYIPWIRETILTNE